MGRYRNKIERGYEFYINNYPEYQPFSIQDYDYPFQEAYLDKEGPNIHIQNVVTQLERECFVELREDVPKVCELPMDDLAWLPVGLTEILKAQRTPDHEALWKTTAKRLPDLNSEYDVFPERLVQNFETIVRAELHYSRVSVSSDDSDWNEQSNKNHIINQAPILARHTAFPTLEGVAKCLMKRDITIDGIVRPGRKVLSYSGDDYTEDCKINVLGHLLWHLEKSVADDTLQSRMEDLRASIELFFKIEDTEDLGAYGFLSDQRNSILHGQIQVVVQFGILLNLLSLLLLNIDHIPEEMLTSPQ